MTAIEEYRLRERIQTALAKVDEWQRAVILLTGVAKDLSNAVQNGLCMSDLKPSTRAWIYAQEHEDKELTQYIRNVMEANATPQAE